MTYWPNDLLTTSWTLHYPQKSYLLFRFLSRVAFLCNLVFLLVTIMHFVPNLQRWDADLVSHLAVTGYFVAIPFTIFVNIYWLFLYLRKKNMNVPLWLRLANLVFLILQILYLQFTWSKKFYKTGQRSCSFFLQLFLWPMRWLPNALAAKFFRWKNCLVCTQPVLACLGSQGFRSILLVAFCCGPLNLWWPTSSTNIMGQKRCAGFQ